jgi:type IV secretion system protein VirB6
MLKLKQLFSILFLALLFTGCSNDRCIDADDFGFAKVKISARYPEKTTVQGASGDEQTFKFVEDYQGKQVGAWIDSGYKLNGQPLTIMVKNWKYDKLRNNATPGFLSAWSPWLGKSKYYNSLPPYLLNLRSCKYINPTDDTCNGKISNAPCLMTKGIGLYGLIMKPDSDPLNPSDPNSSPSIRYNPASIGGHVFHVGDPQNATDAKLYDVDNAFYLHSAGGRAGSGNQAGGIVLNDISNSAKISDYNGGSLYFKILDTDYSDNAGQYIAVIKSGVRNIGFDPFDALAQKFKDMLFGSGGVVPEIYNNILSQSGYRLTVNAILTMYILFTGMGFLIGLIKFTQFELFVRIFKILLISTLISQTSWQFFNDYFFSFFTKGLDSIVGIIQEAATGGQTQGGESIIALIFSEQTIAKLVSLIFMSFSGIIYFLIFLCMVYFVVMMYLKAWILYITAFLMVGIIISMAPIFLCFMLFQVTRSLFDNWLNKLIVYSFQPIILFASLAFLGEMIRNEIYNSLGFRVCQIPIIDIGLTESPLLSLYYPQPANPSDFDNNLVEINVPKPVTKYDTSGNITERYNAYEYIDERYLDLPFLDPKMPPGIGDDQAKIKKFKDEGAFVQFDGLIYLILIVWILHYFNESTISIANTIMGNMSLTKIDNISKNVTFGITSPVNERFNKAMSALKGKAMENSLIRTAVSAYRVAANTASLAGSAIEKGLEYGLYGYSKLADNPGASLLSKGRKEEFAKKHGWLAKAFGIKGALKDDQKFDKMKGEFKEELVGNFANLASSWMELRKGIFDLKYGGTHSNVGDAKSKIADVKNKNTVPLGKSTLENRLGYKFQQIDYKKHFKEALVSLVSSEESELDSVKYARKKNESNQNILEKETEEKMQQLSDWNKEREEADREFKEKMQEMKDKKLSKEQRKKETEALKKERDEKNRAIYRKYDPNKKDE